MLKGINLNIPFWLNALLKLEYSILAEFDIYREPLQQIYAKFIEDNKQRSHIFFHIQDILIKNLAMQGNASFSRLGQFQMAIKARKFREEIELLEVDKIKEEKFIKTLIQPRKQDE